MDLLAFNVNSQFAHFRRIYTTTSPLTYSFPPKTAVIGMIGAILGYSNETLLGNRNEHYSSLFDKIKIGIKIKKKIKTMRIGVRYISSKKKTPIIPFTRGSSRNPIPLEVLVNPSYDIVLIGDRETLRRVWDKLKCPFYTPYLGLSEFIATIKPIKFIKDITVKRNSGLIRTHYVVPDCKPENISQDIIGIRVPNKVDAKHKITEYKMIFYNKDPDKCIEINACDIGSVLFENEWVPLF